MLSLWRAVALALVVAGAPVLVSAQPAGSTPSDAGGSWRGIDGLSIRSHREQADVMRGFLMRRFERILPELMRRHRVDMWVVITREYNDDPVFRSMAPLTTYASRRRTILVFHDRGPERGVERLSIGRFDYDTLYTVVPTHNDGQWAGLRALIDERRPGRSPSTRRGRSRTPTACRTPSTTPSWPRSGPSTPDG